MSVGSRGHEWEIFRMLVRSCAMLLWVSLLLGASAHAADVVVNEYAAEAKKK